MTLMLLDFQQTSLGYPFAFYNDYLDSSGQQK